MIKKEIRDVGEQLLLLMAPFIFFNLVSLIIEAIRKSYDPELHSISWLIFLPLFSMLFGISAFEGDRRQKAIEYMLTLPCSRSRILLAKFLSRFSAIVLVGFLLLISSIALDGNHTSFNPSNIGLSIVISFFLFITGFSISDCFDNNWMALIFYLIVMFICVASLFIIAPLGLAMRSSFMYLAIFEFKNLEQELGYTMGNSYVLIVIIVGMVIPYIISLFLAFRRFDLKPLRHFAWRQFKYFIICYIICIIAFAAIYSHALNCSGSLIHRAHLTQNHKLILTPKYRVGHLLMYEGDGVRWDKIERPMYGWRLLLDDGSFLYYQVSMEKKIGIVRVNMDNLTYEIFYQLPNEYAFWRGWKKISYHKGEFILAARSEPYDSKVDNSHIDRLWQTDRLKLVLVDKRNGDIRRINFQSQFLENYCLPYVINADESNGRNFWIIGSNCARESNNILRLWEDGRVDNLGLTEGSACYAEHLLYLFHGNSIQVHRLQAAGTELVKTIDEPMYLPCRHDDNAMDKIVLIKDNRIFRLDTNTYNLEEIGTLGYKTDKPAVKVYKDFLMDYSNVRRTKLEAIKLYKLTSGRMELLTQMKKVDYAWFAGNGFITVTLKENKWSIYSLPEMKELHFRYFH